MSVENNARRGPKAERGETRDEIQQAAREVFAKCGYPSATIKAIAARAGVDTKLVHYYFGSKSDLFAQIIHQTFQSSGLPELLQEATQKGGSFGVAYMRTVLDSLDGSELGPTVISLLRSLGTHEGGSQIFVNFLNEELVRPLLQYAHQRDLTMRISLMGAQILGVIMGRYIITYPPLSEASADDLAQRVGPVLDHYMTSPLTQTEM